MKKLSFCICSTFLFVSLVSGCAHAAQAPPGPPSYSCQVPVVGGTAYTQLNPAASPTNPPVATLNYNDVNPGVGNWCYIVQSYVSPNSSNPSNTALVNVTGGTATVQLSWNAPTGVDTTGYKYIVSRVAATLNPSPLVPTNVTAPATVAQLQKPAPAAAAQVASIATPQNVRAKIR